MILWGLAIQVVGTIASMLFSFAHDFGPAVVFLPQVIISFGNGIMLPNAIAGAVSVRPQAAGTASGVLGCVQMAIGAVFVQLGGFVLIDAHTALPMAALMAAVVFAYAVAFFFLVRPR
jgi:DHA1 family bicyclomycin/chloramphenicol resistance-like MFS transporter